MASTVENSFEEFYQQSRKTISELYESEKNIFQRINFENLSVLDVGCAMGGFYSIMKEINPTITYRGIDVSEKLIQHAKSIFPETQESFHVGDATALPFDNQSSDIVLCTSVQAHVPNYFQVLEECWRVSKKYVVFDFRMSFQPTYDMGDENGCYWVVNTQDVLQKIGSLPLLKAWMCESYIINPDKHSLQGSLDTHGDVWCGLFLLEKK